MSAPPRHRRSGFTIVEALAASVLLGVGVVACLSAFASLTKGEARALQADRYAALARSKWDELAVDATNSASGDASGDFADEGEPNALWTLTTGVSGVEGLNTVALTVKSRRGGDAAPRVVLSGLRYAPPTGAAAAPAAGGRSR